MLLVAADDDRFDDDEMKIMMMIMVIEMMLMMMMMIMIRLVGKELSYKAFSAKDDPRSNVSRELCTLLHAHACEVDLHPLASQQQHMQVPLEFVIIIINKSNT